MEKYVQHTYIHTTPTTQDRKIFPLFDRWLFRRWFHPLSVGTLRHRNKTQNSSKIYFSCWLLLFWLRCVFVWRRSAKKWKKIQNIGKYRNLNNITLYHTQTQTLSHEIRQNRMNGTHLYAPYNTTDYVQRLFESRKTKNDSENFVEKKKSYTGGFPPIHANRWFAFGIGKHEIYEIRHRIYIFCVAHTATNSSSTLHLKKILKTDGEKWKFRKSCFHDNILSGGWLRVM